MDQAIIGKAKVVLATLINKKVDDWIQNPPSIDGLKDQVKSNIKSWADGQFSSEFDNVQNKKIEDLYELNNETNKRIDAICGEISRISAKVFIDKIEEGGNVTPEDRVMIKTVIDQANSENDFSCGKLSKIWEEQLKAKHIKNYHAQVYVCTDTWGSDTYSTEWIAYRINNRKYIFLYHYNLNGNELVGSSNPTENLHLNIWVRALPHDLDCVQLSKSLARYLNLHTKYFVHTFQAHNFPEDTGGYDENFELKWLSYYYDGVMFATIYKQVA